MITRHARAPPLGDDDAELSVGGLPAAPPGARPRRRALPRLGRARRCPHGAPRGESLPPARPTSTTGSCCSRTTRSAACAVDPRAEAADRYAGDRRRAARARLQAHAARASAAARRRSTGCSPARRPRRSGSSRCWRPRWRRAATRLRALVLCDAELAEAKPDDALPRRARPRRGHGPPRADGARAPTSRTAPLRPLLVSGRGLRCLPGDADVLLEALDGRGRGALRAARSGRRSRTALLVVAALVGRRVGAARVGRPRHAAARRAATTQALVGTRALLGEGWDCPPVNCLVDLTSPRPASRCSRCAAARCGSIPRTREKLASNWDVVCVAPELARGSADYERFVRKHLHLLRARRGRRDRGRAVARAPGARPVRAAAGEPLRRAQPRAASPAPATATRRASAGRSARPTAAPSCRAAGRARRGARRPARTHRGGRPRRRVSQRLPLAVAAAARVVLGSPASATGAGAAARAAWRSCRSALGWAAFRLGRAQRSCRSCSRSTARRARWSTPTASSARCSDAAAGSLDDRAARVRLPALRRSAEATPEESARFAAALDELIDASRTRRATSSAARCPTRRRRRRAARPRAHAPPAVPRAPASGPGRPRAATRSAPRRSHVPGAPGRPEPTHLHAAQRRGPPRPRRGGRRGRRLRDGRARHLGLSAACPAPRPRGPARRGRRRRPRACAASRQRAVAPRPPRGRRSRRRARRSRCARRRSTISRVSGTWSRSSLSSCGAHRSLLLPDGIPVRHRLLRMNRAVALLTHPASVDGEQLVREATSACSAASARSSAAR